MKVILFGGSGMVGQGVLRECLLDEAMLKAARQGAPKRLLETRDIDAL